MDVPRQGRVVAGVGRLVDRVRDRFRGDVGDQAGDDAVAGEEEKERGEPEGREQGVAQDRTGTVGEQRSCQQEEGKLACLEKAEHAAQHGTELPLVGKGVGIGSEAEILADRVDEREHEGAQREQNREGVAPQQLREPAQHLERPVIDVGGLGVRQRAQAGAGDPDLDQGHAREQGYGQEQVLRAHPRRQDGAETAGSQPARGHRRQQPRRCPAQIEAGEVDPGREPEDDVGRDLKEMASGQRQQVQDGMVELQSSPQDDGTASRHHERPTQQAHGRAPVDRRRQRQRHHHAHGREHEIEPGHALRPGPGEHDRRPGGEEHDLDRRYAGGQQQMEAESAAHPGSRHE